MCSASISWSLPLFFSTISFVLSFSFLFQICLHDFTTTSTWMEQRTRLEGKLQKQKELQKVAHHRKEKPGQISHRKNMSAYFLVTCPCHMVKKMGVVVLICKDSAHWKQPTFFHQKGKLPECSCFLFQNGVQKYIGNIFWFFWWNYPSERILKHEYGHNCQTPGEIKTQKSVGKKQNTQNKKHHPQSFLAGTSPSK